MLKSLPIGYEDIREIVDKKLYYVDKSLMIKELLGRGGKVNLFTRPRRFGKTLNMSMLRRFFELEYDQYGNHIDHHDIFQDMKISFCGEKYLSELGAYQIVS